MKIKLIGLCILLFTCYFSFSQSILGVYSSDFNELTIIQSGNSVTGTYKYRNGRIEGTLNGHTLTGLWFQDNGKGKLVFEFNSDFSGYTGKWGYNDAAPTSKWNGTKIAGAQTASTPQQNIPVKTPPSAPKATSSNNTIENGLVSWYQFDGDFNDHSTNSYHATNIGASWTADRHGENNKALSFDGNSSGVRLDNGFPDVFNGSLTVSMWVYFNDDDRSVLFGSYNTANNVCFEKHTNYRLRIWWNNGQIDFFSPNNVVTSNKWFFVTFVRDKGQNKFIIYVNDKEVASTSGIGTDVAPAGPFYIGRDSRTGTTVTNGKIDDVKIYNRALTTQKAESASVPSVIPIAPSAPLEKLSVNLNNSDAIAGDLKQNSIQLNVSKGTFDQPIKLQVKENRSVPQFDKNRANLIGTPFEITIDQKSKRLNKPIQVKLKLEQTEIAELNHPGDLWMGYFNGKSWDYFKPLEVNLSEKYVKFETYHFSDYAKAELTKKEIINDFAYKNAVSQWVENDNNTATKQAIEQMVSKILSEKMGLNNKSLTQDIVEAILKENDYTSLMVSYNDGRMEDFAQDIAVLAGKKICDVVTNDSNAKALLGSVTNHSSKIGAGVKIAVALSNGDGEQAAKELSMEILNTFPLTKLLTITAEITERQINRWKNQELEAAYQVFVNGAESRIPWWGYQVEPGKFDEVWAQMRGLETKILDDAIKNYASLKNMHPGDLNTVVLEKIRRDTKENLRQEFIKRKNQESRIETIQAENIKLISEFERANLLSRNRFGFTDATDFDFRIERLFRIKDMILKDTKSRLGFTGVDDGGIISAQTIAALTQIWYSDNSKEKYRQELIRRGYLKEEKPIAISKVELAKPVEDPPKKKSPAATNTITASSGSDTNADIQGTGKGLWVLVETINYDGKTDLDNTNKNGAYQVSGSCSPGSYNYDWKYLGKADSYYNPPLKSGESYSIKCTVSNPPKVMDAGEVITLNLSLSFTAQNLSYFTPDASVSADFDKWDTKLGFASGASVSFRNSAGKSSFKISTHKSLKVYSVSEKVTAEAPSGVRDIRIALRTLFYPGAKMGTSYIYQWKYAH